MVRRFMVMCVLGTVTSASVCTSASDRFVAASGLDGAGLGMAEPAHGRAWIDNVVYVEDGEAFFSPILGGGVMASEQVEVELGLPFVLVSGDLGSEVGNPYVGVNYVDSGEDVRLRIGGRFGAPLATANSLGEAFVLAMPWASRGLLGINLWVPDAASFVPNGRLEYDVARPVVLTADVALPLLIPVRNRDEMEAILELAPGIGFRPADPVALGFRTPLFINLTLEGGADRAQLSLEPYVRGDIGQAFIAARFTYNVDEPVGPSTDSDGVWGIGTALGGGF